ncbi:hypothetical protein HanIR_Chr05g0217231 [Helianthus annuus]|nr:hypothetical protein HanIR_Chr05g0217231 [Helianthus annuus]
MSSDKQQSKPPPVIGKIGYYTVFVTPTAKPLTGTVSGSAAAGSLRQDGGIVRLKVWLLLGCHCHTSKRYLHSSLDDYLAHWFGLNQSKYQWALDDYYGTREHGEG